LCVVPWATTAAAAEEEEVVEEEEDEEGLVGQSKESLHSISSPFP